MSEEEKPATSAKLRDHIDRGKAADKIGFPDPAAAPLGTDAEAGGVSPEPEEIRRAERQEVDSRPAGPKSASQPRPIDSGLKPHRPRRPWIILLVLLGMGLAVFFVLLAIQG